MNPFKMNFKERSELLMSNLSSLIGKSYSTIKVLKIWTLRNPVSGISILCKKMLLCVASIEVVFPTCGTRMLRI